MPRANRYMLPGYIYHLTHRCHNREFLLRRQLDRTMYCSLLRTCSQKHKISIFGYCVTSNHSHLLAFSDRLGDLSRFMQRLEGGFAQYFNRRKHRSGAYWGQRFHCTMIDDGEHLWNCLRYIDLNMVRAGVVNHPSEWAWCGYDELVGGRKRFRILDTHRLVQLLGLANKESLAEIHGQRIFEAIRGEQIEREVIWTESIAVGRESFLREIAAKTKKRKRLCITATKDGTLYLKERSAQYSVLHQKRSRKN